MTKFVCDVHLPIKVCKFLISQGHEAIHVNQILTGSSTPDTLVTQYADKNDCIVITKDADFRNSYLLRKTPRKLIRVCLGNLSNGELIGLINEHLATINHLNSKENFYMEINRESVVLFE